MNKKYFSKALCYADRTHYLSILILTSLCLILSSLTIFLDGPKAIPQLISVPLISIPIIVINMIIVFFSYTNKKTKQFYMATQPYNKDAMIITKLICFSLSYIIPMIIYGILISMLYLTGTKDLTNLISRAVNSPLLTLWKGIAFVSVSYISLVLFIQFIHVLFGKCRHALLIPFVYGMFILPIALTLIVLYITGISRTLGHQLTNSANILLQWLSSYAEFIANHQGWSILHDLINIAILTPLTVFLNRKVKSEKADDMFMFKPVEVICKVLLSIFIGFCAISVINLILLIIAAKIHSSALGLDIPDYMVTIISIVSIIGGAALSVLSYKITNKIQARRA